MLNPKIGFILFITLFALAGCNTSQESLERSERLDPNNREQQQQIQNNPARDRLGFVRYTQDEFTQNDNEPNRYISVDRTEMADMISRILLQNDDFKEVATLVTDEEALIAFEASEDVSPEEAIKNAEKTALSVLPGYYEIHASSDRSLIQNIETLHYSVVEDADLDTEPLVQTIIDEMKQDDK